MLTMQQEQGLAIARLLVKAGMPVFLAYPDPSSPQGFKLPMGWQNQECDPSVVDSWRPGMALCAVTGRAFDLVDIDPRSGGTEDAIPMPHSYLAAETPSGGRHHFVSALGVASRDGVAPGVDLKSGTLEGTGRGFAFIAPTVRVSKVDGVSREYRWYVGPDGPGLPTADQRAADGSGAMLRGRVMELRRTSPQVATEPRRVPYSVAVREFDRAMHGLADDVRRWKVMGWGGEAHSGLLATTTHLARLNHEQAEAAFLWAFRTAGVEPDEADLAKLYSAIERAVPDIVIPDEQLTEQERFFLGGDSPLGLTSHLGVLSGGVGVLGGSAGMLGATPIPGAEVFAPLTRERFRNRTPPPPPLYGAFGGTVPTFYGEGVHWLQGESESGKTWVALIVLADVLRRGGTGLYVDHEDTLDRVLERLDQLGVTDEEIERLVYVDGTTTGFFELVGHVALTAYTVMVIDGVTSSVSSAGLSGRDEQELTRWCDLLPRRAQMSICVDHVVKSKDDRGGMAIGSQAKKSVVTGSSFEVVCEKKFGRGKEGLIVLNLQKDKPGGIRGAAVKTVRLKFLSDPATGAVVLCVPSAAPREHAADGFFDEGPEVRINALVALLQHHEGTGQTWRPSVEATVRVLRKELGQEGDDRNVLRPAARKYLAAKGYSAYSSDVA